MKIQFGKHIVNLLRKHECVVLPSIGGLILKKVPVQIYNGQILPASKIIKLNTNILNDNDLLISELINKEYISYLEARLKVYKLIEEIQFSLRENGFFDIEDLGRFNLSEDESLNFIPNGSISGLGIESFGFKKLNIFPIQRVIVEEKEANFEVLNQKVKVLPLEEPKEIVVDEYKILVRKPVLMSLVASLLLLFGVFSLVMTDTSIQSLKVQNASVLDFFIPKSTTARYYSNVRENPLIQQDNGSKRKGKKKKKNSEKEQLLEVDKSSIELSDKVEALRTDVKNEKIKLEELKKEQQLSDEIFLDPLLKDILKVHNEDNPFGYYVVIGAYGSLTNANKAKYKCSVDNNTTCKVFKTNSGMYRVAIYCPKDAKETLEYIKDLKKTNNSYWLLENE